MGRYRDLTNQTFNGVLVLRDAGRSNHGTSKWLCKCKCGNEFIVIGNNLVRGITKSCGCLHIKVMTKHGDCRNRFYNIWVGMRQRCNNPKASKYKNYGGRGIKVCERWKTYSLFKLDMFPAYREGLTIDRINCEADYTPENCKWSTYTEQNRNLRHSVYFETPFGKITLGELAEITGFPSKPLKDRGYKMKNYTYEELIKPFIKDGV